MRQLWAKWGHGLREDPTKSTTGVTVDHGMDATDPGGRLGRVVARPAQIGVPPPISMPMR
jgi:hypothetical protein